MFYIDIEKPIDTADWSLVLWRMDY